MSRRDPETEYEHGAYYVEEWPIWRVAVPVAAFVLGVLVGRCA